MSASNKDLIERFCDTLWLQEGLSANTLEAYRRDLEGLERWFSKRGTALASASRADLLEYLSSSVSKGARPRTTARLLSSLRRFYGYLVREEKIKIDPTALIDSPKLGRPLPKSLTEEQVEKLLESPDIEKPLGLTISSIQVVTALNTPKPTKKITIKRTKSLLRRDSLRPSKTRERSS